MVIERFKSDFLGYLSIGVLCAIIIGTKLLSLCVFLLFIYLFTDLFANRLHRFFPRIPALVFLCIFYAVLITLIVLIILKFIPLFSIDFSRYNAVIQQDIINFIQSLSNRFGIAINTDFVKQTILDEMSKSVGKLFKMFQGISKGVLYVIVAMVLNFLFFLEKKAIRKVFIDQSESLSAYLFHFIVHRIKRFYYYFSKVMGGQVFIALINTAISFLIILLLNLPYKFSLVCIVFVCGLFPIVGNIVSNTILSITALVSIGVFGFIICLAALIVIHKLEYFLNSKIIGTIIRLPMFLTLLALLLGEVLLGLFGMIIAIPLMLTVYEELNTLKATEYFKRGEVE
ncbi:MAG: AI-2E family transporter [Chitinivibrionales bacterium]|nr:AI-2E family transporter [Chitinivibrionales bacterium]